MANPKKTAPFRMVSALVETFGLNPAVAVVVLLLVALTGVLAVFWFVRSAPPRTLVLTSGPPGSSFQRFAGSYAKILANNGVTLRVLPSQGSMENLQRLESAQSGVEHRFCSGRTGRGSKARRPGLPWQHRAPAALDLLPQPQADHPSFGAGRPADRGGSPGQRNARPRADAPQGKRHHRQPRELCGIGRGCGGIRTSGRKA